MTGSCQNGNSSEDANEADVEHHSREREGRNSSEEACQNYAEGRVDDGNAGHALDGFLPTGNLLVMSTQPCDDVSVHVYLAMLQM